MSACNQHRATDFRVVSCPDDDAIGEPLYKRGARFSASEFAAMVHLGNMPDGAIVEQYGTRYLVFGAALYVKAMSPRLHNGHAYRATWTKE